MFHIQRSSFAKHFHNPAWHFVATKKYSRRCDAGAINSNLKQISKIAGLLIVLLLLPCFESFNFKNLIYILYSKSLILIQINVLKYMTRILSLILLYFSASLYFHGCASYIICYFWFLTFEKLQKRLLREKNIVISTISQAQKVGLRLVLF